MTNRLFGSASTPACAIAAVLVMTVPASVSAQSSVNVYGRVVAGVEHIDKVRDPASGRVESLTRTASNQWGTSMLGFKGTEDLGDGLNAYFLLESGFGSTTGRTNAPAFFNRRAYVGLGSKEWGRLQFGKNLFNTNDVWYLDPTGQQFISSATLVRGRSWVGADNVIEYTTPSWGGFTANAQLSLGEQAGNHRKLRAEGLSLAYVHEGLELRGIHTVRRDANGLFSDVYNYSKQTVAGGTYRLGASKLFAAVEHITAGAAPANAPTRLRHAWLGVRHDVTPALTLIGAGYHVSANRGHGKAVVLMAGADYALSKRSFLYASVGGVNNSGAANYAADVSANGPGPGAGQRAVYAGMGHSF